MSQEKEKKMFLVLLTGGEKKGSKKSKKYLDEAAEIYSEFLDYDLCPVFVDPTTEILLECSGSVGHDKLYLKVEVDGEMTYMRVYKNSFLFVIVRASKNIDIVSDVVRHFRNNLKVYTTLSADGMIHASRKFKALQIISAAGGRVTKTITFTNPVDLPFIVEKCGGLPLVAKIGKGGSQGEGVFILNDTLSASTALETFKKLNIQILLQQFIESSKDDEKKFDLRLIYVKGHGVVCAMKRYSIKGDFRSNYSKSKDAENFTDSVTDEQINLCKITAESLKLDVVGVDIVIDYETGANYIIEANCCMGVGIIGICDINFFTKAIEMALTESKKSIYALSKSDNQKDIENCKSEIDRVSNHFKKSNKSNFIFKATNSIKKLFTPKAKAQKTPTDDGLFVPKWRSESARKRNWHTWRSIGGDELKADFSNAKIVSSATESQRKTFEFEITNLPTFFFTNINFYQKNSKK